MEKTSNPQQDGSFTDSNPLVLSLPPSGTLSYSPPSPPSPLSLSRFTRPRSVSPLPRPRSPPSFPPSPRGKEDEEEIYITSVSCKVGLMIPKSVPRTVVSTQLNGSRNSLRGYRCRMRRSLPLPLLLGSRWRCPRCCRTLLLAARSPEEVSLPVPLSPSVPSL